MFPNLVIASLYASNPPPTQHSTCPCAHSALRCRHPQHDAGAHPGASASEHHGKPPGRVRRRRDGERLVWRLEARTGRDLIRAHSERLFLILRRTHASRIPLHDAAASTLRCPGRSHLLVQCSAARCSGRVEAFRNEFSLSGDQRPLRHLPLRLLRSVVGYESSPAGCAGIFLGGGACGQASGSALRRYPSVVRAG